MPKKQEDHVDETVTAPEPPKEPTPPEQPTEPEAPEAPEQPPEPETETETTEEEDATTPIDLGDLREVIAFSVDAFCGKIKEAVSAGMSEGQAARVSAHLRRAIDLFDGKNL